MEDLTVILKMAEGVQGEFPLSLTTSILERLQIQALEALESPYAAMNISLDQQWDMISNRMLMNIRTEIWAEVLGEETHEFKISYPSSWWQMFKKQYAPDWFIKRFPIETTTMKKEVEFKKYAKYPKLAKAMPECKDYRIYSYKREL